MNFDYIMTWMYYEYSMVGGIYKCLLFLLYGLSCFYCIFAKVGQNICGHNISVVFDS